LAIGMLNLWRKSVYKYWANTISWSNLHSKDWCFNLTTSSPNFINYCSKLWFQRNR
jgi:hypothetical protein